MKTSTRTLRLLACIGALFLLQSAHGKSQDRNAKKTSNSMNHPDFDYDESAGKPNANLIRKKAKPKYDPNEAEGYKLADNSQLLLARKYCGKGLAKMPNSLKKRQIKNLCRKVNLEQSCFSEKGTPIFHYDRRNYSRRGKRILTISLIHGDEHASGTVASQWMNRLEGLNPRNRWRVIPIVNPDGWAKSSRVNANKVDINRNFPSSDWDKLALDWWKNKKNSDPRRYPGPSASSESETRCLVKQINQFKPDFIIAIHTPLGVMDFDGPRLKAPHSTPLPWQRLGNFPGSLGRFMWVDHNVPVLTIELKGSEGIKKLTQFDRLQDISGTVAIRAGRQLNKSKNKN